MSKVCKYSSNIDTEAREALTELSNILQSKADLVDGVIPSSQLPSYVDDVLEYTSLSEFPTTGESGKVYVDTTSNITYRWSGTTYISIGSDLALGETASTAYAGNKGKTLADKIGSADISSIASTITEAINTLNTNLSNYIRDDVLDANTRFNGIAYNSNNNITNCPYPHGLLFSTTRSSVGFQLFFAYSLAGKNGLWYRDMVNASNNSWISVVDSDDLNEKINNVYTTPQNVTVLTSGCKTFSSTCQYQGFAVVTIRAWNREDNPKMPILPVDGFITLNGRDIAIDYFTNTYQSLVITIPVKVGDVISCTEGFHFTVTLLH